MGVLSFEAELAEYENFHTIVGVLLATLGWTSLYAAFCKINSHRSYEWNCRIVSTLHALIVIVSSFYAGCVQGPFPFTHPGLYTCVSDDNKFRQTAACRE